MPCRILATALPENFSSLLLARKLLMSALIWSSQSKIWKTTRTGSHFISAPLRQGKCHTRGLPCICQSPHSPLEQGRGLLHAFCQSTQREGFSAGGYGCCPTHLRRMTRPGRPRCDAQNQRHINHLGRRIQTLISNIVLTAWLGTFWMPWSRPSAGTAACSPGSALDCGGTDKLCPTPRRSGRHRNGSRRTTKRIPRERHYVLRLKQKHSQLNVKLFGWSTFCNNESVNTVFKVAFKIWSRVLFVQLFGLTPWPVLHCSCLSPRFTRGSCQPIVSATSTTSNSSWSHISTRSPAIRLLANTTATGGQLWASTTLIKVKLTMMTLKQCDIFGKRFSHIFVTFRSCLGPS